MRFFLSKVRPRPDGHPPAYPARAREYGHPGSNPPGTTTIAPPGGGQRFRSSPSSKPRRCLFGEFLLEGVLTGHPSDEP
jgi:hypothetical protein